MECCVGFSTETVLQINKFYNVVKRILKTDVSDCSPSLEWMRQVCKKQKEIKGCRCVRKKTVKKTKSSQRVTESETFIYPVVIKSAQVVNELHFFSLATIVTAVDDRKTKYNKN